MSQWGVVRSGKLVGSIVDVSVAVRVVGYHGIGRAQPCCAGASSVIYCVFLAGLPAIVARERIPVIGIATE
jgi:hypothetical protein